MGAKRATRAGGTKQKAQPAQSKPITRLAAARILGTSVATVRRMEGKALRVRLDINGVHVFESRDVEALKATRTREYVRKRAARGTVSADDGAIAAAVFDLIDDGRSLSEIVRELRLTPRLVRELYAEHNTDLAAGLAAERERQEASAAADAQRAALMREERRRRQELHDAKLREMEARTMRRQMRAMA